MAKAAERVSDTQIEDARLLQEWVDERMWAIDKAIRYYADSIHKLIRNMYEKAYQITRNILNTRVYIHGWAKNQRSMGELLQVYNYLIKDMEQATSCNVELTKLGEDLFLYGEERDDARAILGKHCSVLEVDM